MTRPLQQPAQRGPGDGPAAQARDHGAAAGVTPDQRLVHIGGDDATATRGEGLLEDDDPAGAGEGLADLLEREGAEGLDCEHADPDPGVAHLVDDLLDRPEDGAERHDDRLGTLGAVAAHQPARRASEVDGEALAHLRDRVQRQHLLGVAEVLDLEEGLWPDHRPDRHRLGGVEHVAGLEGRQESVDALLRRDVHLLVGVGEDEAVHADHHRQRDLLRDPVGLDMHVEGLLVRLGVELDPAGVALGHRVGVVVPDVDRGADSAVGDGHHDRQPEAGGVVERLGHVEEALGGGRGVGAGAGGGRADRRGHGAELGLDHQVLAGIELARPDQVREVLDDVGLRGDRIRADHLGPAERHGLRDRAGALFLSAAPVRHA